MISLGSVTLHHVLSNSLHYFQVFKHSCPHFGSCKIRWLKSEVNRGGYTAAKEISFIGFHFLGATGRTKISAAKLKFNCSAQSHSSRIHLAFQSRCTRSLQIQGKSMFYLNYKLLRGLITRPQHTLFYVLLNLLYSHLISWIISTKKSLPIIRACGSLEGKWPHLLFRVSHGQYIPFGVQRTVPQNKCTAYEKLF